MWDCFKFVFVYGLRSGGGIGDATRADNGWFTLTHIFFFLIVTIAMLNIIFGIIIDTFSSLRAEKNERTRDTNEVCFICGKSKQTFDRAANSPDGFKNHIRDDHNMWSYLNFIFFIWEQDKDDDDGLEYWVRKRVEANEIIWFPINKAMRLDDRESDVDALRKSILDDIHVTEKSVFDRMSAIQTDVDGFLDKFTSALKQDFSGTTIKLGISGYLKGLEDFQIEENVVTEAPSAAIGTPSVDQFGAGEEAEAGASGDDQSGGDNVANENNEIDPDADPNAQITSSSVDPEAGSGQLSPDDEEHGES